MQLEMDTKDRSNLLLMQEISIWNKSNGTSDFAIWFIQSQIEGFAFLWDPVSLLMSGLHTFLLLA